MSTAKPSMATELALLLLLASLWGASYTFIKIGVATIPPITFIAARTLIAGLILVVDHAVARAAPAVGCGDLATVPVPGMSQQRDPVHADRLGRDQRRRRARDHPQFHDADLRLPHDGRHHPA